MSNLTVGNMQQAILKFITALGYHSFVYMTPYSAESRVFSEVPDKTIWIKAFKADGVSCIEFKMSGFDFYESGLTVASAKAGA